MSCRRLWLWSGKLEWFCYDCSETDSCLNNYDDIATFRKYKRDDFKSLVVQPILTNKLTDNSFVMCWL